jgi:naphthalene 1,2-dioxygenase system ferredoxin subunit
MKFVKVAADQEIAEGGMKGVEVEGQEILLARVGGTIYGIEAICNHGYAYLEEGGLEGFNVVCPLHDGCFDIRTGQPTVPPCSEPIRSYPIRIEGADVFVGIE